MQLMGVGTLFAVFVFIDFESVQARPTDVIVERGVIGVDFRHLVVEGVEGFSVEAWEG